MSQTRVLTDTEDFPVFPEYKRVRPGSGSHFFLPGAKPVQKNIDSSGYGHKPGKAGLTTREHQLVNHLNQLALAYL